MPRGGARVPLPPHKRSSRQARPMRPTSCSRPRRSAHWTSFSARDWPACARTSCSPRGAGATLRRCCSMRPNGSKLSMRGSRARRTSKRSERRSSPAGSAAGAECGGGPRPPPPAPPGPEPRRPIDLLLDGAATRFTEGYGAGVPALRRALQAFRPEALRSEDDILRSLWLAWLLAGDLWDDEAWYELATHGVRLARETGALTLLPLDLEYRAGVHVHAGEFAAASALIEEAGAISAATGNAPLRYASLFLAAWRGEEAQALKLIEARARDATATGEGRAIGLVKCNPPG